MSTERETPATSLPTVVTPSIRSGEHLAGDDYARTQIDRWFAEEKEAYYEENQGTSESDPYYAYMRWLNPRLGAAVLATSSNASGNMLVVGPGLGREVDAFPNIVKKWQITFVEASENFRRELGVRFPKSTILEAETSGDMPVASNSQDLILAFSVLHHIPNVSYVLGEFARVLKPGGFVMVREPCSSMGDWRMARSATPNERGISCSWLLRTAAKVGLSEYQKPVPVLYYPLALAVKKLGLASIMSTRFYLASDILVSRIASHLDFYWRDSVWKRLGPSVYFYMFRKPE